MMWIEYRLPSKDIKGCFILNSQITVDAASVKTSIETVDQS